jgi:hypothetical protein
MLWEDTAPFVPNWKCCLNIHCVFTTDALLKNVSTTNMLYIIDHCPMVTKWHNVLYPATAAKEHSAAFTETSLDTADHTHIFFRHQPHLHCTVYIKQQKTSLSFSQSFTHCFPVNQEIKRNIGPHSTVVDPTVQTSISYTQGQICVTTST